MLQAIKHYFHPLVKLEKQRQAIVIPETASPELTLLLETPLPEPETLLKDLEFLVLDFETTGLDFEKDSLLSIGNIQMKQNQIDMGTAAHCYVDDDQTIKAESAVINHIVPQMLIEGDRLDEAMNRLFSKMMGKVVMAHGAIIERKFIDSYIKKKYGLDGLPLIWLDTLKIEKHLTFHQKATALELQLNDVRKRYGLPDYNAHNALVDAISTAELYLAQKSKIFGKNAATTTLGEVCNRATCSG
ncbi:exonuclease domain-containing protein [Vibrio gangliei]|uniref:exonuclease domain-containing protein n=1 Tax=Vibrio gangliei TaxID=2077090 RepID=UPI000D020FF4|nr:exonuclease domain-containing protein [Vibrio gangliei]